MVVVVLVVIERMIRPGDPGDEILSGPVTYYCDMNTSMLDSSNKYIQIIFNIGKKYNRTLPSWYISVYMLTVPNVFLFNQPELSECL